MARRPSRLLPSRVRFIDTMPKLLSDHSLIETEALINLREHWVHLLSTSRYSSDYDIWERVVPLDPIHLAELA